MRNYLDIPLTLTGDAKKAANLSAHIGPAKSVISAMGGTETDKAKIILETETQMRGFEIANTVTVPAKIHIYTATNRG